MMHIKEESRKWLMSSCCTITVPLLRECIISSLSLSRTHTVQGRDAASMFN